MGARRLCGGKMVRGVEMTRQKVPPFSRVLTNFSNLCGKKGFVNHSRAIFTATYGVVRP